MTTAIDRIRIHHISNTKNQQAPRTVCFVSCRIVTEIGFIHLNSMALVENEGGKVGLVFPSLNRESQNMDFYYTEGSLRDEIQKQAIELYTAEIALKIKQQAEWDAVHSKNVK